jgi:hypothetical protein
MKKVGFKRLTFREAIIGVYLVVPEKVIWSYKFWAYLVAI